MVTRLAPLQTPGFTWEWSRRTYVMGIISAPQSATGSSGRGGSTAIAPEIARRAPSAGGPG